jgi:nucleotide-binding universal stress UspA family protein
MALKDLLVYVDQSERAAERLRLAADLARRHASRLTAIYVRELNPTQRHEQSIAETRGLSRWPTHRREFQRRADVSSPYFK